MKVKVSFCSRSYQFSVCSMEKNEPLLPIAGDSTVVSTGSHWRVLLTSMDPELYQEVGWPVLGSYRSAWKS